MAEFSATGRAALISMGGTGTVSTCACITAKELSPAHAKTLRPVAIS